MTAFQTVTENLVDFFLVWTWFYDRVRGSIHYMYIASALEWSKKDEELKK